MKVIHLIGGGDVGGAKTHVLSLLQGLQSDTPVKLVSFREGAFAQEARELGLDVEVVACANPIKAYRRVREIILSGGYEIVHCHGARGNMIGALVRMRLHLPVVTTVHSDYRLDYLGRPLAFLTYGVINMIALRVLSYWIGVSDPVTNMLIDRKFPPERLFTIYNGSNLKINTEPFNKREFLHSCGLETQRGDVVAGIAARLSPVKDIPTLLRAFAKAVRLDSRLKLIIAGDGESEEALKQQAQELGLNGKVCFAGWIKDMDRFYRSIDINLLTSRSETFPYALTEGARTGRATIASRVGGVPILIDSGINGLLFEPGDAETLCKHLVTLTQDELMRKRLGNNLRDKVQREFSLERMVEHQKEIYQVMLRRQNRPRKKRDGVIICGAYGQENSGDDAILKAILMQMRQIDPDMPLRVLSRNPKKTRKVYRVSAQYTFNPIQLWRNMRKSVLYINGGGNLIQNATSERSLWFYLKTLQIAKKAGCRVIMYGCGIGPVHGKWSRRRTARIINRCVEVITLREDDSQQELKEIGVRLPKVILAADPTLSLPPASEERVDSFLLTHEILPQRRYICFSLRLWPGFRGKAELFGHAASYAYEKYGLFPLFLPIETGGGDLRAAQMALKGVYCPYEIIEDAGDVDVTIGLLSRMDVVVSMRLHGLIFASGCGVPLVGVVYDEKVSAFLRYIGQNLFVKLEELNYEGLCHLIDEAVLRGKDRHTQMDAVEHLRTLERRSQDVVREILKQES